MPDGAFWLEGAAGATMLIPIAVGRSETKPRLFIVILLSFDLDNASATNSAGSSVCICAGGTIWQIVPLLQTDLGQHPHETEHAIIDKMRLDPTDHQIYSRIGEMHDFNTVARLQARIQSPVYSVSGIVDQRRPRWLRYRDS